MQGSRFLGWEIVHMLVPANQEYTPPHSCRAVQISSAFGCDCCPSVYCPLVIVWVGQFTSSICFVYYTGCLVVQEAWRLWQRLQCEAVHSKQNSAHWRQVIVLPPCFWQGQRHNAPVPLLPPQPKFSTYGSREKRWPPLILGT